LSKPDVAASGSSGAAGDPAALVASADPGSAGGSGDPVAAGSADASADAGGAPAEAMPGGQRRASRLVDIAEAVGVHVSTVSRVLNGDPAQSIRPEVYERILATARQQGYRPNALARALKRQRTGALAFVLPLERNPSWARMQGGALRRASELGYVVMIMEELTEEPKPPGDYRYLVEESRADGLLLATPLRIREHADGMTGAPHVYVNRRGPDRGNDVVMDEPGAVRMFLDHAAGLGHRSFALIEGPPEVDTVHRRATAARRICAARGYDLTIRHAAPSEDGGWDAVTKMLRRGPRPTACGVGHLTQLFGVMAALRAAGVEVPGDMSVVSFDEDQCLAFLEVPISSVCMPLPELGAAAVDALIARVEGRPAGDVMVSEPMSLCQRASVAPPHDRDGAPELPGS
jgi:DNA-binding LacI/PurR family transcriptional regulator